jgi:sulfatase modifying factor 1
VYEWCSDLYGAYVPGGGEQGPMDKPRRVLRGGSWLKDAKQLRSAARARNTPGSRNADNGFRVVVGAKATVAAPVPTQTTPLEVPPAPLEAPPAPPETYAPPARAGGSNCILPMFLIGFLVTAALIIFVVVAIRKRANPMPLAPRPLLRRAAPRIADDGFWFDTSGYTAGHVVTYTYTGRNGAVTEQFLVDPNSNEQFVYTGVRPSDVVLGAMMASQQDQPLPPPQPLFRPSTPTFRTDDDDRPRRNPPAY